MFNLIVSSSLQTESRGSILASRVFQYTDDEISDHFKPNGKLDIPALKLLPTVFMKDGCESRMAVMSAAWFVEFRQRLPWLLHVD